MFLLRSCQPATFALTSRRAGLSISGRVGGPCGTGDNLTVLRESIADESVDLVYLDPPFNSNASYNVLFKAPTGERSQAQIEAFDDTWHWNESAERAFDEVMTGGHSDAAIMLKAMRSALGENDMMAYLATMAVRLIELHRVLKATGSLYLHCDPTASHYLKILLDAIFGPGVFGNEIIWKRTSSKSDFSQGARHLPRVHDILLRFQKSSDATFRQLFVKHDLSYTQSKYPYTDSDGLWDMTGPGGAAKGNPSYEVLGIERYWRYSRERMSALLADGLVVQPSPGAVPRESLVVPMAPQPAGRVFNASGKPIHGIRVEMKAAK
jgi:hypothetical protein